MSHRKYEAPRRGSLQFLPRKRCSHTRGIARAFPKDDQTKKPHLTAFLGYKAGGTHVVREIRRPGSKIHNKETVEHVTLIECPPMCVVGLVGYTETPQGLRNLSTVMAQNLDISFKRRLFKSWKVAQKKAYSKYAASFAGEDGKKSFNEKIENIKAHAQVIRVIAHTQPSKIGGLNSKKAHVMEIQINGGKVQEKVDYAVSLFEKNVPVSNVFEGDETIDAIAVSKGKGFEGVTTRWGTTRLPRKTHKGLRKVACIGSWHPANVAFSVARAGQNGFHHRTDINKKIFRIGNGSAKDSGTTSSDLTQKKITPMGGIPNYGVINEDFVMIKGSCPGVKRRVITLRKAMFPVTKRAHNEIVNIKFIDTASKSGIGRFQTTDEKRKTLGPSKRQAEILAKKKAKEAKEAKEKSKSEKAQGAAAPAPAKEQKGKKAQKPKEQPKAVKAQ